MWSRAWSYQFHLCEIFCIYICERMNFKLWWVELVFLVRTRCLQYYFNLCKPHSKLRCNIHKNGIVICESLFLDAFSLEGWVYLFIFFINSIYNLISLNSMILLIVLYFLLKFNKWRVIRSFLLFKLLDFFTIIPTYLLFIYNFLLRLLWIHLRLLRNFTVINGWS